MTRLDFSKEERERIIFQSFVKVGHLPVLPDSIRSKPWPAPDILCEIQGRGFVAFELVEIVTPALARELANGQELREALVAACEGHSEIAARYRDALIYVGYKVTTIHQRLSAVPEVVEVLRQHSENARGYIAVPYKLRKVLIEISISRGVSDGPAFDVMNMTKRTEEIFGQIEKKCKKRYSHDYPIELLAHYTTQPSSDSFNWGSEFHDFVLKTLPESPFERVWVCDNWSDTIKYVHPAPASVPAWHGPIPPSTGPGSR